MYVCTLVCRDIEIVERESETERITGWVMNNFETEEEGKEEEEANAKKDRSFLFFWCST